MLVSENRRLPLVVAAKVLILKGNICKIFRNSQLGNSPGGKAESLRVKLTNIGLVISRLLEGSAAPDCGAHTHLFYLDESRDSAKRILSGDGNCG